MTTRSLGAAVANRLGLPAARLGHRGDAEHMLPERVRFAIRTQQDESERLIGWIQLAVVATFGSLYLVSPKVDRGYDLAPWAIVIYLGLTVIRLVWARHARLPDWSLAVSTVFDIALLMVLIWSFHLKYEQPASFYLKAPTLLYVFIFIALRALRFEVRYVVLTGLVAAIGWLTLILYVLMSGADPMITRDYIRYLTSNSILIGAEIDKIVSILTVTAILAIALRRARRLLVQSVVEETAARELSRFFAPEVAKRIKAAASEIQAGHGEMRDAAILNVDIRGFTCYAASAAPDMVMQMLSEYQAIMVPIVRKHRGAVDKFLGDGILATFGAVSPSVSHAADALRALEEIIAAGRQWAASRGSTFGMAPRVNGAVACGRVLFGAVGSQMRLEYTVIGDAVNLSAKLEKANKDLGVAGLCNVATYRLAVEQGYRASEPVRRVERAEVAGIAEPIDLCVIAT